MDLYELEASHQSGLLCDFQASKDLHLGESCLPITWPPLSVLALSNSAPARKERG